MMTMDRCALQGIIAALEDDIEDMVSWAALYDWCEEQDRGARKRANTVASYASLLLDACMQGARASKSQIEAVEYHHAYAEPGYTDPECGIIATGNWNSVDEDDMPERLSELLERLGVSCEWSDEWSSCGGCGKLVRTEPDCYDWEPSYHISDSDIYCRECRAPDTSDD